MSCFISTMIDGGRWLMCDLSGGLMIEFAAMAVVIVLLAGSVIAWANWHVATAMRREDDL